MPSRFTVAICGLLAAVALAPLSAQSIKPVWVPPGGQRGLDMLVTEEEAMPPEPELANRPPITEDVSWSGAAIDLLMPVHHLYTDFRRQLARYQDKWSVLPQVHVPTAGIAMRTGSTDPRVATLRERLGMDPAGGFDEALKRKLAEYQLAHGLHDDGIAGQDTLRSLNRGAIYYERLILLGMERARRLPAPADGSRYILVDAGSARLWMYENGRPVDSMKVIVGTPATETPMMAALIRYASVNPYWNVPPELVTKLIAPRVIAEGPAYLQAKGYEVLEHWGDEAPVKDPSTVDWAAVAAGRQSVRVRQLPSALNSMGKIKFMMPNEFGIYLHDTPSKALFEGSERWLSNGCVRVEDAPRLARWLFGSMPEAPDAAREHRVDLPKPVPVYITYLTVGVDRGTLAFRPDPYDRDRPVLARFNRSDGVENPNSQERSGNLPPI